MDIEETKILRAAITAVGGYTPKTILSNKKLEEIGWKQEIFIQKNQIQNI